MDDQINYDPNWRRDIGYGVPANCDYPRCTAQIDRGLSYVCGSEPYGGEHGCGLFFCGWHMYYMAVADPHRNGVAVCERCQYNLSLGDRWRAQRPYFEPTRDIKTWAHWKLTHKSWALWRSDHPDEVARLRTRFGKKMKGNRES